MTRKTGINSGNNIKAHTKSNSRLAPDWDQKLNFASKKTNEKCGFTSRIPNKKELSENGFLCLEYLSEHCSKRSDDVTDRSGTEGAMRLLCFHPNVLLELE